MRSNLTRLFSGRLRMPLVLAIAALSGVVFVALTIGPNPRAMQVSAAATHVFIDTPGMNAVNRQEFPVGTLIRRGEVYSETVVSPPVVARAAKRAGIPVDQIGADTRSTANVPVDLLQPGLEERSNAIAQTGRPYSIEAQARQITPILDIYTRAPTTAEAIKLADAAVAGLQDELRAIADRQHVPAQDRLRLVRAGAPRGGVVSAGMPMAIAFFAFLLMASIVAVSLAYLTRPPERRQPRLPAPPAEDPWPHTSRLLPWMLAVFLAILWLMPFNDIELTVHLPIDLKFDRLILPFIFALWVVSFMVGGRLRPRLQLTKIHAAVGAFVVLAFLSVIMDARYLNQTLELETAFKQLPLLLAYVSLFLIMSTSVRSNEVWPFLKYTLILAVLCAVGTLFEYRFKQNLFYTWSDKLLPSVFTVPQINAGAVDIIGRRMVRGPAALPLETVAMLAMALPIGLVATMRAPGWRGRFLYGMATCLLLAAMFATFRKSALLAPLAVIATVAYFRRRELLKLAPLGLVLIVIIHVAAPGALGTTTSQFDPSALGVSTVSDRASDYDAVRPDVWTHLVFGRGWGSYDWLTFRILDSEFLHRTIEMGVLGVLAYAGMMISVVYSARRMIAARDRTWAPLALIGAASAISFLVVSGLFDVMAFPHATYIFLYSAGLTAVVVKQRAAPGVPPSERVLPAPVADLRPPQPPAEPRRALEPVLS